MRTDPAKLEMMRSYFNAIASGMGHVIERTSFTTFVKESADFATALATPSGDFFVYPKTVGVTIFLGLSLKKAIEEIGPMQQGDIIITNDPYTTDGLATHLPDVHIIKPIFVDGEIVSFAWSFVHVSDVGGLVPSSISPTATDVHQEGLRIPPVKIYEGGKENHVVRTFLRANSRASHLNDGDINAMIAAVNTADIRLKEMIEKFGKNEVKQGMIDLLKQAEDRAGKVIEAIPDGASEFADYLDDDMISDVPIRLKIKLTIKGKRLTLDFSECDPQVKTAFNLVTNGQKHSFLYQGLINYIISKDPFIPINGGITYPIDVISPKGTLVHPEYPASVGIRHSITMRLYNVVLGAIGKLLPEAVPAAGAGQSAIVVLSVPDDQTSGRKMYVVEPLGGGGGAQNGTDGVDGIDHSSGFLKNTPIESLEQHIDIHVHRYELLPNTGGAGENRGGHAIGLEFEMMKPESMVTARGMERMKFQPWGLMGGRAGAVGEVKLITANGEKQDQPKIDVLRLEKGDIVQLISPSGGGWGDPFARKKEKVLQEVEADLLSEERALQQYGVKVYLDENEWKIDEEQTSRVREKADDSISTNVWDFGEQRAAYEKVWTDEASSELAVQLRSYPANERTHYKHAVHQHFSHRNEPLTKEDITLALRQMNGQKGGNGS
ncbi:hydantoinase B/oxoprolinase family protein [Bacillus safensis]|uniref:hydantoinase B/oxoprolinase family protein n=1 Tax=Bacillus safensis TaxID=561879 RepID=UPI000597DD45|nr:hydantoinase B/oxoprolinase family protein [Bacillus safensis]KIL11744.1 N-methylhydantoinase B [Bacillus safensis]